MKSQYSNLVEKRIVVAVTEYHARQDLAGLLEDAGYLVVAAVETGNQAILAARSLAADIVLLDANLSGTAGSRVARELREQRIAPSILLFSGHAGVDGRAVREAQTAGAAAVLTPPLDQSRIKPVIELTIHNWGLERQLTERNRKLERNLCTREVVSDAKFLLMELRGVSEDEAYRRLRIQSMNTRQPMYRIAEALLLAHQLPAAS